MTPSCNCKFLLDPPPFEGTARTCTGGGGPYGDCGCPYAHAGCGGPYAGGCDPYAGGGAWGDPYILILEAAELMSSFPRLQMLIVHGMAIIHYGDSKIH